MSLIISDSRMCDIIPRGWPGEENFHYSWFRSLCGAAVFTEYEGPACGCESPAGGSGSNVPSRGGAISRCPSDRSHI